MRLFSGLLVALPGRRVRVRYGLHTHVCLRRKRSTHISYGRATLHCGQSFWSARMRGYMRVISSVISWVAYPGYYTDTFSAPLIELGDTIRYVCPVRGGASDRGSMTGSEVGPTRRRSTRCRGVVSVEQGHFWDNGWDCPGWRRIYCACAIVAT